MNTLHRLIASKIFQRVMIFTAGICVCLVMFEAGMFVGFEKARFGDAIGDRYFHMMSPSAMPFTPHGAFGQVVEVKPPLIVVLDRDGTDKTVTLASSTQIRDGDGDESVNTIHVGDTVIVFGDTATSSGTITAALVRVLPKP